MLTVNREHFTRAALEIGQSGENDTLPYDIDLLQNLTDAYVELGIDFRRRLDLFCCL